MQDLKSVQELKNRIDQNNSGDVLLDVRTPEEFANGHIKAAINFNISHLNIVAEMEQLDNTKTYIVYCRSGGRSQMASMIMKQKKLKVINSVAGFMHWEMAGNEIAY
jgi:rhodanese-related sulfurtransferase